MKEIGNEEFNEALQNSDNKAIMLKVMGRFRKIIRDWDLLKQLARIALFKAMQKYDNKSCKFTTYLYKMVTWEILVHLKTKTIKTVSIDNVPEIAQKFISRIEMLDSLSDYEKDILHKRNVEKRTLSEIAIEYNLCPETIREHLIKISNKIKDDYLN